MYMAKVSNNEAASKVAPFDHLLNSNTCNFHLEHPLKSDFWLEHAESPRLNNPTVKVKSRKTVKLVIFAAAAAANVCVRLTK